jgi:hypothetical protein
MDAAQKPCYFAIKYSHLSAVLPRRPCVALHRLALPVHPPPTNGKIISACRRDDLGVANDNVTVTDQACPQHFRLSRLAVERPAGACGEQGALSAYS